MGVLQLLTFIAIKREGLPLEHDLVLLASADEYKTDVIACLCPMCQLNMDAYQSAVNAHFSTNYSLPIVYFTQLLGLAFGLSPKQLGFGKELVAAEPVIAAKVGV